MRKFKIAVMLAVASLAVLCFSAGLYSAKADGFEPSYKDSYSAPVYSGRSRLDTPHRLRPYLSSEELRTLRSIKARAERRMALRHAGRRERAYVYETPRYRKSRAYRYGGPVIPPPSIRYAASRRMIDDGEYRGGRECKPMVSVEGEERGSEGRARGNAKDTWRRATISRFGYRFASLETARNQRFDCIQLGKNKLGWPLYSCGLSARPCREN